MAMAPLLVFFFFNPAMTLPSWGTTRLVPLFPIFIFCPAQKRKHPGSVDRVWEFRCCPSNSFWFADVSLSATSGDQPRCRPRSVTRKVWSEPFPATTLPRHEGPDFYPFNLWFGWIRLCSSPPSQLTVDGTWVCFCCPFPASRKTHVFCMGFDFGHAGGSNNSASGDSAGQPLP